MVWTLYLDPGLAKVDLRWLKTLTRSHVPSEMVRSCERALASAALEKSLWLIRVRNGHGCLTLRLCRCSLHVGNAAALSQRSVTSGQ